MPHAPNSSQKSNASSRRPKPDERNAVGRRCEVCAAENPKDFCLTSSRSASDASSNVPRFSIETLDAVLAIKRSAVKQGASIVS